MVDETAPQPENEMTEQEMDAYFENEGQDELPEESTEEIVPEETADEIVPEEKEETREEKYVPIHALHEERERRKELTQKLNGMEARFQEMLERMKTPEQEPEPPPPLEENPVLNLDERIRRAEEALQQQNKQTTEQQRRQQQLQQQQQMIASYQADAARFSENQKDFTDAYRYWLEGRSSELTAMGMTPAEADNVVKQEEAAAVWRAMQNGDSPAERMYNIAKARGFKPKTQKPDIETIDRGQRASGSLSKSGGSAPPADSLEALAAMSDEDFDKNFDRIIAKMR